MKIPKENNVDPFISRIGGFYHCLEESWNHKCRSQKRSEKTFYLHLQIKRATFKVKGHSLLVVEPRLRERQGSFWLQITDAFLFEAWPEQWMSFAVEQHVWGCLLHPISGSTLSCNFPRWWLTNSWHNIRLQTEPFYFLAHSVFENIGISPLCPAKPSAASFKGGRSSKESRPVEAHCSGTSWQGFQGIKGIGGWGPCQVG